MKKIIFITFLFVSSFSLKAQIDEPVLPPPELEPIEMEETPLIVAEKMPEYPGGQREMIKFLFKNIKYPLQAIEQYKQGTIYVEFVVDTTGNVINPKAIRLFDDSCAKEAVRVVSLMKWIPGEQNGKKVSVRMTLPIKFVLKD